MVVSSYHRVQILDYFFTSPQVLDKAVLCWVWLFDWEDRGVIQGQTKCNQSYFQKPFENWLNSLVGFLLKGVSGVPESLFNGICTSLVFLPYPGCHQPTLPALPFCRPGRRGAGRWEFFPFLRCPWVPCRRTACSGGTLMSRSSNRTVTWALKLQRRSWPKRETGHTGIYKILCFRVRSPNWHSKGCQKNSFVPMTRMDWDVFCATLVFTTECVPPVSIGKSINSLPTLPPPLPPCRRPPGDWMPQVQGRSRASLFIRMFLSFNHMRGSCLSVIVFLLIPYPWATYFPMPLLLAVSLLLPSQQWLTSLQVITHLGIQSCC